MQCSTKLITKKNKTPKIQKLVEKAVPHKCYDTFKSQDKREIILEMAEELNYFNGHTEEEEEYFLQNNLESLKLAVCQLEAKDYNAILSKILRKKITNFDSSTEVLCRWRKKVKGWIGSFNNPETRGSVIIRSDQTQEFKQYLFPVLRALPQRSLALLKPKIIEILRHMKVPCSDESLSKHWWFDFMKRNSDVKEIWKTLILKRAPRSKKHKESMDSYTDEQSPESAEDEASMIEEEHTEEKFTDAASSQGSHTSETPYNNHAFQGEFSNMCLEDIQMPNLNFNQMPSLHFRESYYNQSDLRSDFLDFQDISKPAEQSTTFRYSSTNAYTTSHTNGLQEEETLSNMHNETGKDPADMFIDYAIKFERKESNLFQARGKFQLEQEFAGEPTYYNGHIQYDNYNGNYFYENQDYTTY